MDAISVAAQCLATRKFRPMDLSIHRACFRAGILSPPMALRPFFLFGYQSVWRKQNL
jgi:hypothetical protein